MGLINHFKKEIIKMLKLVFYRKKVAMKDMSFDKFSNIIYLLICKESFCIGGISIIRMYDH